MNNPTEKQRRHLSSRSRRASGQRLKATLEEYAISHAGFSELLRISPQCLANWFARGIPKTRMEQLARLLSVPEVWLATGESASCVTEAPERAMR